MILKLAFILLTFSGSGSSVCVDLIEESTNVLYIECSYISDLTEIPAQYDNFTKILKIVNANGVFFSLRRNPSLNVANIQHFDLSKSGTLRLSYEGFNEFPNLEILNISNCGLTEFKGERFQSVSSLKILDFSRNKLTTLHQFDLRFLTNIYKLYLDGNNFVFIENDCFINLYNLNFLSLRNNYINLRNKTLDSTFNFGIPVHLNYLDLSENMITFVRFIKFINVSYSLEFPELNTLKELYLSGNQLKELHNHCFVGVRFVITLNLSKNQIRNIHDESLQPFKSLHYLDLSENQIENISGNIFWKNRDLWELNLSKNFIKTIGTNFVMSRLLVVLNLRHNHIDSIDPRFLGKNIMLSSLDISYNFIAKIPDDLARVLSRFTNLNISFNRLTYFPRSFDASKIHSLSIEGNPLQCACLDELIQTLVTNIEFFSNPFFMGKHPVCIATGVDICDYTENQYSKEIMIYDRELILSILLDN